MPKLIRITTVPMALRYLLPGQMHFMKEHGFEVLMISADGPELNDVISNEGCRHIVVPLTRKITPFKDLACLFRLIRLIRKEKPDIVHTHTPKAGLLGMMAARFCGVKIRIHTVAGLPMMVEKGFRYRLLKFIEKRTYAAANHVWPNSNSLLNFIVKHKLTIPGKLKVIAKGSTNGIDTVFFNRDTIDPRKLSELKHSLNHSPENHYLLFTGRLVADKGLPELLHVFSRLQKDQPQLRLLLAGAFEPMLDPLAPEDIRTIEQNPSIIHINWTNDVKYYMALSDHFIFPSRREGFPNVLLQAGAMELPIVCSRIAGNIDIVTHHETGLIFDDGNEVQMEEQLRYALENPEEVQAMAKELHRVILQDYRRENIWQNILTAYKSLLN